MVTIPSGVRVPVMTTIDRTCTTTRPRREIASAQPVRESKLGAPSAALRDPGHHEMSAAAYSIRREGSTVIVTGEIDAHAAEPLRRTLATGPVDAIDMSDVTFFSAAGISVLVAHHVGTHADPIVRTSPAIERLIDLCSPLDAFDR